MCGAFTFGISMQGEVCDKTGTMVSGLWPPITGTRNSPGSLDPRKTSLVTMLLALIVSMLVSPNILFGS